MRTSLFQESQRFLFELDYLKLNCLNVYCFNENNLLRRNFGIGFHRLKSIEKEKI